MQVTLIDLVARKDLNRQQGEIIGFDRVKGRYRIQCGKKNDTEIVAIKPVNVILPPPTRVVIEGLVGAARHNGRKGMVVEYDKGSGRYSVQVAREEVLKLKRENCFCL